MQKRRTEVPHGQRVFDAMEKQVVGEKHAGPGQVDRAADVCGCREGAE
jgi:hypothetical protein